MRFPIDYIFISQNYKLTHKAIDFGNGGKKDQPIYAVADGVYYKKDYNKMGGYRLWVLHNDGKCSKYVHLKKDSILIKKGDKVKQGQQIATMGTTGTASTGVHLHFELYKSKSCLTHYKPLDYLFVYPDQEVKEITQKAYTLHKYGELKKCIGNYVRIRTSPTIKLNNKTGKYLQRGDIAKIYAYDNGFYKISDINSLWVSASYLK